MRSADTVIHAPLALHRYFATGRAESRETFEMLKTRLRLTRHILAGLIDLPRCGSLSGNTFTRYMVMAQQECADSPNKARRGEEEERRGEESLTRLDILSGPLYRSSVKNASARDKSRDTFESAMR